MQHPTRQHNTFRNLNKHLPRTITMTRFEGLEVRIRVGNTILPEYAPALNLRSRAGPESKYIQAVPGGNISVLITVLDDFKWYNAHGFHIRLDLGGFKCVCRFGEKEEPLAKAKTRSKEIDSGVCKNAASGYWERTHFRFGHPRQSTFHPQSITSKSSMACS